MANKWVEVTPALLADNVVGWVRDHPSWSWRWVLSHYARVWSVSKPDTARARRLIRRRLQTEEDTTHGRNA